MAEGVATVWQGVGSALLVGLSGFLYLYSSYFKRFQLAHLAPQTRASLSLAYGLIFLFVAAIVSWLLQGKMPRLEAAWIAVSPLQGIRAPFIVAPVLGFAYGVLGNLFRLVRNSDLIYLKDRKHPIHTNLLRPRMRVAALSDLAKSTEDRLLWTLWRAVTLGKLVQVTLKSGKVYIGSPLASLDPSSPSGWIKIIPIASGYRDQDNQSYIQTTDYRDLFEAMAERAKSLSSPEVQSRASPGNGHNIYFDPHDLGILITWSEVVSLTIHEPGLQSYFSSFDANSDELAPETYQPNLRY